MLSFWPPTPRRLSVVATVALAAWLAGLAPASAADPFQFSLSDKPVNLVPAPTLRPNLAQPWHLFVANPTADQQNLRVVLNANGVKTSVDIPNAEPMMGTTPHWKLVQLTLPKPPEAKPAAPPAKPEPVPAPKPPPPAGTPAAAVPAETMPKGVALKPDTQGRFSFTLQLFLLTGPGKDKTPYATQVVAPEFVYPATYLQTPTAEYAPRGGHQVLSVHVAALPKLQGAACPLTLTFPSQRGLNIKALTAGVYRRSLPPGGKATLTAEDLPVTAAGDTEGRFYVGADGMPRTFLFTPHWSRLGREAITLNSNERRVRVYPGAGYGDRPERLALVPDKKLPVRIEVDNPPPGAALEIGLDRDGDGAFAPNSDEIQTLSSAYDQGVWLDTSDQGLVFTTQARDWIVNLDTSDLRGPHRLRVRLFGKGANGAEEVATSESLLVLDDTPPLIELGPLPDKQVRNRPMPVSAVVTDPESRVVRVLFIFGAVAPDGKLPAGAPVAEGVRSANNRWTALLPLPDGVKPGPALITVVAENEAGLQGATPPKKILLIEPPPPPTTGKIKGTVSLGGRPQPGATVQLFDANKKAVGGASTNAKGEYLIEGVPPGGYRVVGFKPDSGVGTRGAAVVTVKASDEPAKADIELSRRPLPP